MRSSKFENFILPAWTATIAPSALQNSLGLENDSDFISFSLGLPAIEFFPKQLCAKIVEEIILTDPMAFQYAPPLEELKSHIVEIMSLRGVSCDESQIFLTSGAQQGISLLTRLLLEPNGEIVTEELTYPGFLQVAKPFSPRILTVSTDFKTGINVDEIEAILKKDHRPAFLYIVTDGSNPHSLNTAEYKRQQLAQLANQYGLPIIEDDPYGFLNYGKSLPCLKHYAGNWVFYVGSFSKIFAPSLRTGWIVAPKNLLAKIGYLKESSDLNITTLAHRAVNILLRKGIFNEHVQYLRAEYTKKRNCMANALKKYFPSKIKFAIPESGIFFWLSLPQCINVQELLQLALREAKVSFLPGDNFSAKEGIKVPNGIRINFSLNNEQKIEQGIERLSSIVHSILRKEESMGCI